VGIKSGGSFVLCGRLSATPVLGAYGHHHQNCQKNVHTSESSGKDRRTRLSKNYVNCSSGGGAVGEFWWVLNLVGLLCYVAGYQLRLYWELTVTTTRTARKTCTHQRAAESIGEQGYQKILSIAVAVVVQWGNSGGY